MKTYPQIILNADPLSQEARASLSQGFNEIMLIAEALARLIPPGHFPNTRLDASLIAHAAAAALSRVSMNQDDALTPAGEMLLSVARAEAWEFAGKVG